MRRAGAPHSYESHDSRSLEEGNSDHLRNINLTSVIPHARRVGETLSLCIINDAFSDHKSSKNLQYTTTTNAYIVNIPRHSAHTTSLRKHATEDIKASPRDAIDTAGAASSESSSGLHRSAKHKTLAL